MTPRSPSSIPTIPDKARKLLAEAGFKEGTPIEIGGYPDQDSVQREEILIEQFRKAGMNVKFVNAPIAERFCRPSSVRRRSGSGCSRPGPAGPTRA